MEHKDLNSTLLALLDSVLLPRSCAYIAGPLESGLSYYEQKVAGSQNPKVREDNERRLKVFAQTLRARLTYPVFDPGTFRIDGWTDAQHGAFFLQVIERIVKEAWFIDGWQFSHGATKEFMFCLKLEIPCFSETGQILGLEAGRSLIYKAAEYLETLGVDSSRLRSRLQ
jgi:hypothetical protein